MFFTPSSKITQIPMRETMTPQKMSPVRPFPEQVSLQRLSHSLFASRFPVANEVPQLLQ
jgi:hypothetical protein